MALVLKDRVKETTSTTGTGTYTLAGAVSGFEAFSEIGNGNTTYYACTDGTDFEVGIGTYTASGTTLARTTILQSSNSDNAVSWSSGTRTIFCTQPAEKAVFLNADGDIDFENTATRIKLESNAGNSGSGDPSISIAGGGPNYIRFHDGTDFTSTTNAVDIVYRTSPNDLLIERASGENIAEFGGDDGHAALYFNDSKKLETVSGGIDVTGTVTDDGATHDGDVTFTGASYNVLWDKSDNAFELADNAKLKFGAGDDMEIYSDGNYGRIDVNDLIIRGDDTDNRPQLYFQSHNTSNVVDYDTSTSFYFQGPNDASEQVTYNTIHSVTLDVSDGTEDGRIQFSQLEAGASTSTFIFDPYYFLLMSEQQLAWYQYNGSYSTYLYPLTPTANRFIRLPDRDGLVRVVDQQVMTADLAVGWHTIAVFQGRDDSGSGNQRFHAKFSLLDIASSRHQAMTFYAQHIFGRDNGLQIIGNSTYSTDIVTAIRIKSSTDSHFDHTYAGAAIQVYVANATNNLILYLDEANTDDGENGVSYGNVILKTGVADASDPGDVGYSSVGYSTFASSVNVGTDSIEPGGIGVTGNLLTQSNIVLEGATADAHETIITATDATADRTITLPDATGQVVLSDGAIDTDASAEIGRAHIGNMGFSDYAGFSHVDQNSTTGYAFLQHSDGNTFLNAPSGSVIDFNIHNSSIALISSTGLHLFGSKVISFEGSTTDDHETTLTVTDPTADRTITLPDATGTVQLTDGSGASLTSLNASQLSSGTVPNARLDQQLQDVAGLAVTNGNFIVGDGSNFVAESGSTARASLGLGTIATQAADSVNIDGGAVDAVTLGTNSAVTEAQIDNININGNDITSTNSNGAIGITPNGTGDVFLGTDTVLVGDFNSNATITTNGTGDLTLNTNSGTNSGSIVIPDGANENIRITPNGTGSVLITSTDDGASEQPILDIYRNSASPAVSDLVGTIKFSGENDADQKLQYAEIQAQIADETDATEDGSLLFQVRRNGTLTSLMSVSGSAGRVNILNGDLFLSTSADIVFEGATSNANEITLTVTDPTADRTITLPDATGTVLTTGNSDTPTTTTSSSDADFVLIDDGGTMKKITPANLGITAGAASTDDATALAIALG